VIPNLNRVKLRDGNWLSSSSILRNKNPGFLDSLHMLNGEKQKAVLYARNIIQANDHSPDFLEVGFADFLDAPGIEVIDFSQFTGKVNSRILIHLGNGQKTDSIQVQIINWDGSPGFEGLADQGLFPTEWVFTLPKDNAQPWSRIVIGFGG